MLKIACCFFVAKLVVCDFYGLHFILAAVIGLAGGFVVAATGRIGKDAGVGQTASAIMQRNNQAARKQQVEIQQQDGQKTFHRTQR